MSEGHVRGGLAAVDGDVANFELQAKRDGVKAADLSVASADAFELGDQATANQGLKRIGGGVEEQRGETKKNQGDEGKKIFPPTARGLGGIGGDGHHHCDWTPGSFDEAATPGMWT